MKKVLTIQDISCFGKCSITVALPIISAMGVETVILPTAVLSTHTMFKNFTVKDLTDQLVPITDHWKKEGLKFDAIYTGYLGSAEEIEIAKKIFAEFGGTEACFMTDTEYKEVYDEDYVKDLLQKLAGLGSKVVVLTGVSLSEGKTGVYGLDTRTGEYFTYQNDRVNVSYHGTGDVFSSVSVGAIARGLSMKEAFRLAADYTARTIQVTEENPENPWYGVDFEATIPELVEALG